MTRSETAVKLVRFQKPELSLPYLNGAVETHIAGLFGLGTEEYRSLCADLAAQARTAAADLLIDPDVADQVDRIPFAAGARIVALGESSTADRLSWFEILRYLLELRRPADRIELINSAVAGSTTSQTLKGIGALRFQRPDWVLCQLGANDAQRFGALGLRVVSAAETARNIAMLRDQAPGTPWVWLTPTDVDEALIAEFPPFRAQGISWRSTDQEETSELLRAQSDPVVDVLAVTREKPGLRMFEQDGVHLTPAGQVTVARAVVAALAALG